MLLISTLDGWWDEAWRPDADLGWALGEGEEYDDPEYQDFLESKSLYEVLENTVLPEFYDRGRAGLPRSWIGRMKHALKELGAEYNSHRMVDEYARTAYLPVCRNYDLLVEDDYRRAKELAAWRTELMTKWDGLHIRNVSSQDSGTIYVGDKVEVRVEVQLGGIDPDHVRVEVYAGPLNYDGGFAGRWAAAMQPVGDPQDGWQPYLGGIEPQEAGRFGFTVRHSAFPSLSS